MGQPFATVGDYVWAGGWVEMVILLASVVAFVAIVDCLLKTRQSSTAPAGFWGEVRRRLSSEGAKQAAAFCATQKSLVADALRVGLRRADEGILAMEAGAFQTLEEGLAALYARLVLPLAVAVVAPLLGLFGAVLSLVRLFRQVMSSSPPTAEEVAQGVVASLVPLATGLIVSIIVMCFYFFLRRRIVKVGVAASIPLRESLEEGFQRR